MVRDIEEYKEIFECVCREGIRIATARYEIEEWERGNFAFTNKWKRCASLYVQRKYFTSYDKMVKKEVSPAKMDEFMKAISTSIKHISKEDRLMLEVARLRGLLEAEKAKNEKMRLRLERGSVLWLTAEETNRELTVFTDRPRKPFITSTSRVGKMEFFRQVLPVHAGADPVRLRYFLEVWDDVKQEFRMI